jgi:hypothetical protein
MIYTGLLLEEQTRPDRFLKPVRSNPVQIIEEPTLLQLRLTHKKSCTEINHQIAATDDELISIVQDRF